MACQVPDALPAAHRPWAAQVSGLFQALNIPVDLQAPTSVGDATVQKAIQARWLGELAASEKPKVQHYITVVRGGLSVEAYQPAAYLAAVADRPRRVRVAQLRTGSHWLKVETGRWQRLEKNARVCPHCKSAAVEDEMHMIFDCPRYAGLRQLFADLFSSGDRNLGSFLSQDPVRVAQFIYECYRFDA